MKSGRLKGGIRYNCMQQLIAPSATCDSKAKDRTKLQVRCCHNAYKVGENRESALETVQH
ncbi:hypothetical protein T4D_2689 [Trichinella pseudospiralis]|uniref:Uncharacterized protein n=1 Tax=Trichinella pseudospiralis TaxID=6337 RepID=A0A0V1F5S0_TRIPS|nr:hypothetical protein T4D_2689 [Trichinella pseudospiralis]